MSYTIDKNVPVPERTGGKAKYPLRDMAIGDSFFVAQVTLRGSVVALAWHLRPKKFATRKVEGGFRVWRTA